MTLRRIALGLAVAALVVVAVLVLVAAVLERAGGPPGASGPVRQEVHSSSASGGAPRDTARAVPSSWMRMRAGEVSYAVPPGWARRPATERVAYREDGAVIAAGRGQALRSVRGCPLAWAVLADPVRSSNVRGVAEATALAWARGYAGLPVRSGLRASRAAATELAGGGAGWGSRVEVGLGGGSGCAGERAELTAVARQSGDEVVTLVVARYLDVPGTPSDAAYDGVAGSLSVH